MLIKVHMNIAQMMYIQNEFKTNTFILSLSIRQVNIPSEVETDTRKKSKNRSCCCSLCFCFNYMFNDLKSGKNTIISVHRLRICGLMLFIRNTIEFYLHFFFT